MAHSFGSRSLQNMMKLHPDLIRILNITIQHRDITVVDGDRSVEEQVKNVEKGVSKTMESKHLIQADGTAWAMDVMPYPLKWPEIEKGMNAVRRVDPGLAVLEAYATAGFIQG